ncbi:MAG: DNA polymerase III subunit gamma/tau [Acidobacteriota bacterium]
MSYQVLARKWRPQRFDDVLGQQAVTRTLSNALTSARVAHALVFAGPRGCGKTTTARILARALNCVTGPTPSPCGTCEPCVEIAEGRDIDVLEIDAATHTGVDNVREVIIEGLAIAPVRDRYKIFLIDEVHMLSGSSFNALLKSIEEPPPHVVFMMATTELEKIPDTVRSRSQVHEFRTLSSKTIADQLRRIANAESIEIPDDALHLLARAGEGSMRDSLSALDQVRAFAGDTIGVEDVATVLGLVGRDLVLDVLDAVAAEEAPAAFALVERAIERGYDLRMLCRELARATRDLLVLSVDPARLNDADVAAEGERGRLTDLTERWSREDLLRAFDALTRAEQEVKQSDQPRFHMEMALLRLMHLRKLVPLADLLKAGGSGTTSASSASGAGRLSGGSGPTSATRAVAVPRPTPRTPAAPLARPAPVAADVPDAPDAPDALDAPDVPDAPEALDALAAPDLKTSFLSQIRASKRFFYNTVVAQAYRVDATPERITFSFLPNQRVPRQQCEQDRGWLEGLAQQIAGRRIPVTVAIVDATGVPEPSATPRAVPQAPPPAAVDDQLRSEALADPAVQALFEIFPVEKTKIEDVS